MDIKEDETSAPPADDVAAINGPQKTVAAVQQATVNAGSQSEAETEILSDKEDGLKKQKRKAIKLEHADVLSETVPSHDERGDGLHSPSRSGNSLKRKRGAQEPTGSDPQDEQDSSRLSSPEAERHSSVETDHSESSPPFDDTTNRSGVTTKSDRNDHSKGKTASGNTPNGHHRRDTRSATDFDETTNRSTSSPPRKPQRAQSSQSNPAQAQPPKKRRKTPAPLQVDRRSRPSEDAHDSDSSSLRSHPRDQPLKSADIGMGVWKASKLTSKKNMDRSGRTLLARACTNNLEETEKWLEERPEDIDVADYAGNTPLQIASLNGNADIVRLLIAHKCKTNCENVDKDTPLIDAVENGHLEVVRLLLDAGVDPTQRNAMGKEPAELVDSDADETGAMRSLLERSKKVKDKRRVLDDRDRRQNSASRDPETASSKNAGGSPTHSTRSPPFDPTNKRRTARSQHTSDALLWVSATPARLRDAAGKGDMAIVDHILRMRPEVDTEAVLAAAIGGHHEVLGMMLAIAQPKPDPSPLQGPNVNPAYSTPMLASIGRGNIEVVRLLLEQPGFDPTR